MVKLIFEGFDLLEIAWHQPQRSIVTLMQRKLQSAMSELQNTQ